MYMLTHFKAHSKHYLFDLHNKPMIYPTSLSMFTSSPLFMRVSKVGSDDLTIKQGKVQCGKGEKEWVYSRET